ncbi:MAG: hypothetical protein EOO77_14280 [Oxalobacteraceae bacterium]|nr:MAG: hypothetical protein EOO77_14280 [Oxalobacteraceae bacterium]
MSDPLYRPMPNPMSGSHLHKLNSNGSVTMRELRTVEEQIEGVTLTDEQIIQRLANQVVNLEQIINYISDENIDMVTKLQDKIREIEPYAFFYKTMQDTILGNPALMMEWQSFCLLLKMIDPDKEKYDAL